MIKVFGVGDGGIRALGKIMHELPHRVEYIAVNTEINSLNKNRVSKIIPLGRDPMYRIGTGGTPILGRRAAIESADDLRLQMAGVSKLFIVGGFGGSTGSGAIPVIADIALNAGFAPSVVVTLPFTFEGAMRSQTAQQGMDALRQVAIAPIVMGLDQLLPFEESQPDIIRLYALADAVIAWHVLSRCVP
jgi:cell division protein FtsZ